MTETQQSSKAPVVIVGGGRMGDALLAGLLNAGAGPVVVVEKDPARRSELSSARSAAIVGSADELVSHLGGDPPSGVVLAVKPADTAAVCAELVGAKVPLPRVLSIAAGVTLASLESSLAGVPVIRAMPNTPALVGAGASAMAAGHRAGSADLDWAKQILEAVGVVVELPEHSLDAVTGLSGSGPAYVFLLAEALVDAGVLVGLSRPVSLQLAVQTLIGSARMLAETGEEPVSLRAAVTSPGGTTAAGLRALEAGGLRHAVLEAVSAATERSRELGRS
jgi:pyrroline-5-carboxylate reductase